MFDRAQRDPRSGGLVHGVDLHVGVVESEDLVGLKAVGEEPAGQRGADDDGDDRMPSVAGRVIRVGGRRHGLMQACHFLVAAVGLAGEIDDGDDGPLVLGVPVGVDDARGRPGPGQATP